MNFGKILKKKLLPKKPSNYNWFHLNSYYYNIIITNELFSHGKTFTDGYQLNGQRLMANDIITNKPYFKAFLKTK